MSSLAGSSVSQNCKCERTSRSQLSPSQFQPDRVFRMQWFAEGESTAGRTFDPLSVEYFL
jgi:hypothetical protein